MAKSRQTFQKSEKEKKKRQKQAEKDEKRELRKQQSNKGKGLELMMAYVDHNGQLTDTPPDKSLKVEIKAEDIILGPRDFSKDAEPLVRKGKVELYNFQKKYGFIRDGFSGENLFFHITDVNFDIKEGDKVTYDVAKTPKGMSAIKIEKAM